VFNRDLSLRTGWPKSTGNNRESSSPVVADLDQDGDLEIIFASSDRNLYVWHQDGTAFSANWPKAMEDVNRWSDPVAADFDADGKLEIVSVANTTITMWETDGSVKPGWPVRGRWTFGKPSVGDVDNDGKPELVIGDYGYGLFAFNEDGTYAEGWPVTFNGIYMVWAPIIGDINGDGKQEIIVTNHNTNPAHILIYSSKGELIASKKLFAKSLIASPAITDLDNDGILELIVCTYDTREIYVWELQNSNAATAHLDWPFPRGNPQCTGCLPLRHPPELEPIDNQTVDEGKLLQFKVSTQDPDGDVITYSLYQAGDLDHDNILELQTGGDDMNLFNQAAFSKRG
jgi:hypothetical protein